MTVSGQQESLVGRTLGDRYHVDATLGAGAMSVVYRALDQETGEAVAVKVLQDHLVEQEDQRVRFEREARALFALDHPHILKVHNFGVVNNKPYLVMEVLEGTTLDLYIEEHAPNPRDALSLARQILEGLAHAHANGVLHRDLKSENVFVARNASGGLSAKLLDFGLVKFVDDTMWGRGQQLTTIGQVFGTPAYMSPEQCAGANVDASTDVYSMGVLLYELLTGEWPFMEESQAEMIRAHLMKPAPKLAESSSEAAFAPELDQVIGRAMQKDAKDRYQNAGAMLAELSQIPEPILSMPPPPPMRDSIALGALPAPGRLPDVRGRPGRSLLVPALLILALFVLGAALASGISVLIIRSL